VERLYLFDKTKESRSTGRGSWRFQGNGPDRPGVIINPILIPCTGGGPATTEIPTRDATSRLTRPAVRTAAIGADRARGASRRRRNRG